jgi:hypothetical protein
MTPEWLQQVLKDGRQRQRAAAALELSIQQKREGFSLRCGPRGLASYKLLGKT